MSHSRRSLNLSTRATLLHDDVVDASEMRRGVKTANRVWGNEAGVLVGDFLYSRAFQMIAAIGNVQVMEVLSDATNLLAEGEVMQLVRRNNPNTTTEQYLEIIRRKTAMLFSAAAEIGAIITEADSKQQKAMSDYGLYLGNAFQLIDDVLDYSGTVKGLGKNVGDDLAEGKTTMPLIYAMQKGTKAQSDLIVQAICQGGLEKFDDIFNAIKDTGALEYTRNAAMNEAEKAKQCLVDLPDNPCRDALSELADFAVARTN